MTFKTPEDRKKVWTWVFKQVKLYLTTVIAILGTVWGVAEFYLQDFVDARVERHLIENQKKNKPLREIIGERLNLENEIVPYYMVTKFNEIDSLKKEVANFEEDYLPYLDWQLKITPMYRFLDEYGDEWWHGPDGKNYRVNYDDGQPWVVYHSHRRDL